MKKQLLGLCMATAAMGASAQTAEVFGTVDAGVARLTGNGVSKTGLSTGGANISRLGFRGTEDLGGGLKAGFWLEAGLDVDTGQGKTSGGLSFNRRATVSLLGGFGEVRLGRDDSATFLSTLIFDPFLTNGVGGTMAFAMQGIPGAPGGPIQYSNAISYFTPQILGGFSAQLQYGFGETASNAAYSKAGNYAAVRAGYRAGPLNLALAAGKMNGATAAADNVLVNFGAWYDFGVVKPTFLYASEKVNSVKISATQIGFTAPLGSGQLRASYGRYDTSNSNADWNKLAVGYGYDLSKRTQVYGTIARISNKDGAQKSIAPQGMTGTGTTLGGSAGGLELGIRHFF